MTTTAEQATRFTLSDFLRNLNTKLEPKVQKHLTRVYICVTMCALVAAVGAYVHIFTNILSGGWLSLLALIGFWIGIGSTHNSSTSTITRIGMLLGFAFCSGLLAGPMLGLAMFIDAAIIPTALLITCLIFGCFSICSLLSQRFKYVLIGTHLFSILNILFILTVANIFLGSQIIFEAGLYLGIAVMCGFVMYDTQLIIERCRLGNQDYVWDSVTLYIDFKNIFEDILVLLITKEAEKKNRQNGNRSYSLPSPDN